MGKTQLPNLIIGSGRTAMHFKHYFALKGVPTLDWNRKEHIESDLPERLLRVSSVLLLISDSSIEDFRNKHLIGFKGSIIHFSGCLEVPGIESFHPLMTFGPTLYDLAFYEKIYFAASSPEKFRSCFPDLSNPVFELKTQDKALYHALCVMSGNFSQILWRTCLTDLNKLGVPSEALLLYLQKNLENFSANPTQSLTGPLARNDRQTIQKNIDALPPPLQALYSAFVRFYTQHC